MVCENCHCKVNRLVVFCLPNRVCRVCVRCRNSLTSLLNYYDAYTIDKFIRKD